MPEIILIHFVLFFSYNKLFTAKKSEQLKINSSLFENWKFCVQFVCHHDADIINFVEYC